MGRPKGSKNHSFQVEEIAKRFDREPFDILMMIANGDWEGLGFKEPTKITYTAQGIEVEEQNIPLSERNKAAAKACAYLYSEKQSVEVSGDLGIKLIVEDYLSKE